MSKNQKLQWGTAHFRSTPDAKRYYEQQGSNYSLLLLEGSIFIGEPSYNPLTERLSLDSDGRYWIEEL